jgi:hypothetical protein
MGAGNVALAFQIYAGKVPPTSMQVLLYMALVSKDADANPWFSKGREAIAELALGRTMPFDRSDARAVERAIEPLLAVGAISTDRKASVRRDGDSTARYRLNLSITDAPRKSWAEKRAHAPRKTSGEKAAAKDSRPTKSAPHAPRNSSSRPTVSVLTPHENRGPEDKEDLSRSEIEEEMAGVQTASRPPRATAPSEPASVVELFPGVTGEAPYRPPPSIVSRWRNRPDPFAEAAERRRKAEADHQARLAEEA